MNILLIEDQIDFIEEVKTAAQGRLNILSPTDVHLLGDPTVGTPIEEQIRDKLLLIIPRYKIDLVLLDTDLSRAKGKLEPQSSYQVALQELGIPVCRYRKGMSETKFAWWSRLQRVAVDGASAIWVTKDMVSGAKFSELTPWLKHICEGFAAIVEKLERQPELLKKHDQFGPADVLAVVLDRPSAKPDFLGYSHQNFFFFLAPNQHLDRPEYPTAERRYATRLGYWLYNYILTFPGPILSIGAAAALLNLTLSAITHEKVRTLIEGCRYLGPFGQLEPYYWRDKLTELLEDVDGDIATSPTLRNLHLERVDSANPSAETYLCVLSNELIPKESCAVNPDWIPPGAYQARIKAEHLDELGPLMGI